MADFNEDDSSFTFTDGTGKTLTLPKSENFMTPGGVYDVAKKNFSAPVGPMGPPSSAAIPQAGMAGGQTFDPTAGVYNGVMDNAVNQSFQQTPGGAPAQVPLGQGNPNAEVSQLGQPAKPDPAEQQLPRMPAIMQLGEQTFQSSKMGNEARAADRDLLKKQDAAVNAKIEADTVQNQVAAARATAELNMIDEQNKEIAVRAQQRDNEYNRRMEDIRKAEDEYANMSIDSDRLFGDKGTGSKLLAVIGMSLGALGGGLAGRDFGVNQLVMKAIENDIDAQKAQMAKAGDVVKQKRGALGDFLQASRDMDAAKNLEFARQLSVVQKQYDAIAASSSNAQVKANALALSAQFANERAQRIAQVDKQMYTNTVRDTANTKMVGEANDQASMDKVQTNAQMKASITRIRELKKTIGTGPIEGRINKLKSAFGATDMDDAEFQGRLSSMMSDAVRSVSGATASDQERSHIEKAIANNTLGDEAFDRMLDVMEQRIDGSNKALERQAREQGKRPIDTNGYYQDYLKAQGGNTFSFKRAGN